jgi:hypothetical protein
VLGPLATGNTLTKDMGEHDALAMLGAHAHVTIGIRIDPAIDLTIALFGVSAAIASGELDDRVSSVVRYNPIFFGLRVQI